MSRTIYRVDPALLDNNTLEKRFWAKVDKNGPLFDGTPCWLWTGGKNHAGYGQIRDKGKTLRTHVVALRLAGRVKPEGMECDHRCRVPACANQLHLEWVTHAENVRRGEGGKHHADKVACPQGHPYSGDNLYIDTKGGRECRTCKRASHRKYRAAHREEHKRYMREYNAARKAATL